jgi:hypothetical protein
MKLIAAAFTALFLAALSLSVPAPIFTTEASANRMDGKPTCGQMNCAQDRYYAAKRRESKTSVGGLFHSRMLFFAFDIPRRPEAAGSRP